MMKEMLNTWDKHYPGRLETIFTSLQNVAPSQLADRKLFDFMTLQQEAGESEDEGICDGVSQDVIEVPMRLSSIDHIKIANMPTGRIAASQDEGLEVLSL